MTQTTREKKLAFIRSFGTRALERAIMEAVYRNGADHFLTDEQLDEITSQQVADARFTNHHTIRNRARSRARIEALEASPSQTQPE